MSLAPTPMFPKPNGKPAKQPKKWAALGGLTFEQYARLTHAERQAVDAANAKGLVYELHTDKTFDKPYWKGIRPKP